VAPISIAFQTQRALYFFNAIEFVILSSAEGKSYQVSNGT